MTEQKRKCVDKAAINKLCHNVLGHVFSYVPSMSHGWLMRVCKTWNRAARQSYAWPDYVTFPYDEFVLKRVVEQHCTRPLSATWIISQDRINAESEWGWNPTLSPPWKSTLLFLTIQAAEGLPQPHIYRFNVDWIYDCVNLRQLTLPSWWRIFMDLDKWPQQLQSLTCSDILQPTLKNHIGLVSNNLIHLDIDDPSPGVLTFPDVFTHCPSFVRLRLGFCTVADFDEKVVLPTRLQLESLRLPWVHRTEMNVLTEWMARLWTNTNLAHTLRELEIPHLETDVPELFELLIKTRMPNLCIVTLGLALTLVETAKIIRTYLSIQILMDPNLPHAGTNACRWNTAMNMKCLLEQDMCVNIHVLENQTLLDEWSRSQLASIHPNRIIGKERSLILACTHADGCGPQGIHCPWKR